MSRVINGLRPKGLDSSLPASGGKVVHFPHWHDLSEVHWKSLKRALGHSYKILLFQGSLEQALRKAEMQRPGLQESEAAN
jgi:hypothetical protein